MIYISYNEHDLTSVNYLNQILKTQGFETWLVSEKLLAGESLQIKFDKGIKQSKIFIFCIGKYGISDWQNEELNFVLQIHRQLNIKIIPVLLPNNETKVYNEILSEFQYIDFRTEFKNKEENSKLFNAILGKGEEVFISTNIKNFEEEIRAKGKLTAKKAVSIAIIKDNSILIVQRAETQKTGGGLWQLPGGKVDNKESNDQAAIREIKEEVGINLNIQDITFVNNFIDTWVVDNKDDYIVMSLYITFINKLPLDISSEFKDYKWLPISEIFANPEIIYFGSTSKFIKNIRRYVLTHLPLKEISNFLENNFKKEINLPKKLKGISTESTQIIYSFLSLLGFLSDRSDYTPSSTLSHHLLKILSEWALTDGVIFEAMSNNNTFETIRKNENPIAVQRFKEGLFDHHENLLGLLSHKLPKALSTRFVADLLIFGKTEYSDEKLILVRWDFLANKYQIPSKGLENIESDIKNIETAKFVVGTRLSKEIINKFNYKYVTKFETQHIGAASLSLLEGDGPMLRNYIVSVFNIYPKLNEHYNINTIIDTINKNTIDYIELIRNGCNNFSHNDRRNLNFYTWVSTNLLLQEPTRIVGEVLQGFAEIIDNIDFSLLEETINPLKILATDNVPITYLNSDNNHKTEIREKYATIFNNK